MNSTLKRVYKILVTLLVIAIGISIALGQLNKPLNKNDNTMVSVVIPEGSSTDDIANILVDSGVIKNANNYKIISRIWRYDGKYLAGRYMVSPSMTSNEIAKTLIQGSNDLKSFTIPEGLTIKQTARKLADDGIVDYKTFLETLEKGDFSFDFLKNAQSGKDHLEGFLFPNTYSIEEGADSEQIITTMLNQFDIVFTDEYKSRAKELGYSEYEIVIIASLIEREAMLEEERPLVASVIYNRLENDMKLQFCSSVQYLLGTNKPILSIADTEIESPYNTYMNEGLPPGPICSPGEASIKAALYPEKTDYMYFVLSEKLDGSQNFSKDEETFLENTEKFAEAYEKQQAELGE